MLFGSVVDSASEEASAEESAEVSAEGAAEAAVSEAAGASVLEEQPVTRPRQSARERAGTTNFLIILPPWPVSGRINFRVAAVKNVVAVRSSYGILLKGFEKVQKKHATACLNMTFRQNADSLYLGRVQAGDGRSFLGSSQPGTRTPSQSGFRHRSNFSDRSVRALPLTLHSVNRLGLYHRNVEMARMENCAGLL